MPQWMAAFLLFGLASGYTKLEVLYGQNISCATSLPETSSLRSYFIQLKRGARPVDVLPQGIGMYSAVSAPLSMNGIEIPHHEQHRIGLYFANSSSCVRGLDFSKLLLVAAANGTLFSGLQHGVMWYAVQQVLSRNVLLWDWVLSNDGCGLIQQHSSLRVENLLSIHISALASR